MRGHASSSGCSPTSAKATHHDPPLRQPLRPRPQGLEGERLSAHAHGSAHTAALVAVDHAVQRRIRPSQARRVAANATCTRDLPQTQHQRRRGAICHRLVQVLPASQVENDRRAGLVQMPATGRDHLVALPDRQHPAIARPLAAQAVVDRPPQAGRPVAARDERRAPVARPQHQTRKPQTRELRLDADLAALPAATGGGDLDGESEVGGRRGARCSRSGRHVYKSTIGCAYARVAYTRTMVPGLTNEDLLTLRDAARRIGVHENTVRNWVKRGVLEPVTVPGSRYRRFQADDIDRVAHQQEVSSAKARRTEGTTELVDADYLDSWAGSRQAEELVPEVVKRLIEGTKGVIGASVRSGDGIRARGWDGLVEGSSGSPWVPAGPSAWEIGTGGDPARKVDDEYRSRTANPLEVEPSAASFVFVTPRRWPRARQWEHERRAEGTWRGVRVLDADDLAGWLRSQPAVHLWLSEEVGLQPLEVRTLSQWWRRFSGQTEPPLPAELLLAGREESARRLRAEVSSERASVLVVRATSREEATAFIAAALETAQDTPTAALVATSPRGWERLSIASEPAVLVPYFDDPHVAAAVGRGHHVIVPVPAGTGPSRHEIIELGPLDRAAAREVLVQKSSFSFEKADRLAGLARRSLASLLRDPVLTAEPRSSPPWAQGNHARLLACLVLVGAWTPTDADQRVVAQIAGAEWATVEDEVVGWSTSSDPPFVHAAGGWQVVSPDGAWALLHRAVQASDIDRFCNAALEVLGETDPILELTQDERLLAGVRGLRRAFSPVLAEGVAQGLALLGTSEEVLPNGSALREYADETVSELLRRANNDASALLWRSISRQLQLLAEASPDQFLDAVEAGLSGENPVLLRMFTDRDEGSSLSTSSEHTGLLWALELLSWAREHLSRAAGALARLAEIDPGGHLANRPAASLRTVFLPWIPQTSASLECRLQALDRLRKGHPDTAWRLEMAMMPAGHDTSTFTPRPRFRRWATSEERVPLGEWLQTISEILARALADAGTDPMRWADLISHVADLPNDQRDKLLAGLEDLSSQSTADEARLQLWATLVKLVGHHRSFPDARWSLDEETLARLEAVARSFEPEDLVLRYAPLFDWRPDLPGVDPHDYEGHDRALVAARSEAIRRIVQTSGMEGIQRLARLSKLPEHVGAQTAAVAPGEHFFEVRTLLGRPDELGRFAHGWVARMAAEPDSPWLDRVGRDLPRWPLETQVAFLVALGSPTNRLLALLDSLDEAIRRRYWQTVRPFAVDDEVVTAVVHGLLAHNRPWAAIDVLSLARHRHRTDESPPISMELVIDALDRALASDSIDGGGAVSAQYEVGQLLDYLKARTVDEDTLARFEWGFFRMLEHTREPRALYAALARDPDLFVELVCRVYRAKNAPASTESDEQSVATAQNAWSVLNDWRRPPGLDEDGRIDAQHLRSWTRRARLQLADRGRADIGDQQIGQVLSGSPSGADGIWPAEEIRELIEQLASKNLETGLAVGIYNSRGLTTRGMFDGGVHEWALAEKHRTSAEVVIDQWPRTGRLLKQLAADYEREARREDAEAHALANEL
jgi:excisionase family DNA binding protein